ncbi:DNA binding protein [Coprinopsis sp. MPI-PUGE-AT-0042]|nr:DNA binding protein [Coprinopsis sp. MPI-PUGE-AT-0042]
MSDEPAISREPRPIRKLDQTLINRIAAGEIIHRPASALKELIENCLDAGATSIKVTVKDGGLKLLQIQDNGCGIRKGDLPILAERFTTSKLSSFSDLAKIQTYGFRGEALASISHVARLSVVTKTKTETCAWKANYVDGQLVSNKPGRPAEPEPCAGNDGTTIIVENLFYNTPIRLSALRNNSEEYARILDVMTKYAIHNPRVSFLCKKAGSASPELSTPPNSNVPQAIRLLYGHSIAKELLEAKVSSQCPGDEDDQDRMDVDNAGLRNGSWSAELHFTNPNYQAKKFNFLLFINHRLVESPRMKRALETVYHSILPKGASPFVYLSLELDPKTVDVNVHPTKREVHFLNEEEITDRLCSAMQDTLSSQASSRSFEIQTLLTPHVTSSSGPTNKAKGKQRAAEEDTMDEGNDEAAGGALTIPTQKPQDHTKRTYSHHKVRTSVQDRTLDSMFPVVNPSQIPGAPPGTQKYRTQGERTAEDTPPVASDTSSRTHEIPESDCLLTSVQALRSAVTKAKHKQLADILEKHIFVGIVDLERSVSLLQHSTNLYLVNHASIAEEMFYQLGLRQFGDFARLKLEPPPSLRRLLEIAIEVEDTTESRLSKDELAEKIANLLLERREMLSEYFSLDISEDGNVESVPLLLRDYIPNLDNLPSLLMRLGPQVDWTSEKECFETFLHELSYFYAPLTFPDAVAQDSDEAAKEQESAERWQIQHVLFPAMRRYICPPKSLLDNDVVQIASLPELYKVFERC